MTRTATIAACAMLVLPLMGCTPRTNSTRPALGVMPDRTTLLVAGDALGLELHGAVAPF